ncbi:MAG: hypothetical protein KU37_10595 [Sulfuricurvum sp. PC08-66]|nr:MAG: hypothetical protein KU37_10595 [Sulfuricurvum sp. PC08-66]
MFFLTIITITLLIIIGLMHLYWVLGGTKGLDKALPTKDGVRLLNPPKALTFLVAIVLWGFSYVAFSLYFDTAHTKSMVYMGWMISAIFFLRAIGEFNAVGFFKKIKNTPFAVYDTKYFSPLTLFWSIIFALLSIQKI